MQAFFSSDGSYVVQFAVLFIVILILMIGGYLLLRRLTGRSLSLTAGAGTRSRQPRLGIVDIYELDRHRQLILLRRDNVEHLLLVGGPNDVVIERHIQRGAGARYTADGAREPEATGPDALDGPRAERFLDSPTPPTFTMPEVVPPDLPGAEPVHPERSPPLDPGLFEPEEPSTQAPARPASAMSRLIRRTPPPLATPRPEPTVERPRPDATTPRPAPPAVSSRPQAAEPMPEPPPLIAGRGPRAVDPSVLSDMARQLQVALKRPSSAVTPPPGPSAEAPARAAEPAQTPALDPLAAAMAAAQADPLDAPAAARAQPPLPPAPVVPPSLATTAPSKTAPSKPAPAPATAPTFVPAPPPAPAEAPAVRAAEAKPAETKPVEAKPVEAKPVEAKPVEAKPVASTPVEARPVVPELAAFKPVAPARAQPTAAEVKPAPALSAEAKPEQPAVTAPDTKPDAARPDLAKTERGPSADPAGVGPGTPDRATPSEPASSDGLPQGQTPFSVEEIEAEFARLLGRPLDTKR